MQVTLVDTHFVRNASAEYMFFRRPKMFIEIRKCFLVVVLCLLQDLMLTYNVFIRTCTLREWRSCHVGSLS